jgi:hypothetical protein
VYLCIDPQNREEKRKMERKRIKYMQKEDLKNDKKSA